MPVVLLATSDGWPGLFDDDVPLLHSLQDRGVDARPAIWDDPSIAWGDADLIVLRSIWDYTWKRSEFIAWVHAASGQTPMHNPARIAEWNSHKGYLRDLSVAGVPIVPTEWIARGSSVDVRAIARERGWSEIVVKPCVSAGARGVVRGDTARAQEHVDSLIGAQDLMLQPYLVETEGSGEHSLVHFNGVLSHTMRKDAALAVADYASWNVVAAEPHPDEIAVARAVLSFTGPLLYARVDTIVLNGRAHLMELEVIEPQLFLRASGTADRFAEHVIAAI